MKLAMKVIQVACSFVGLAPSLAAQSAFNGSWVLTNQGNVISDAYAVDLDGDGDVDVISASYNDGVIRLHRNLGYGVQWSQDVVTTAVDGPSSVYAADVNGDGFPDLISGSSIDGKVAWYANDGQGHFGPQQILTQGSLGAVEAVYAADLDGDGDIDVLSALYGVDMIAWYENDGAGNFGWQQLISNSADGASDVSVADLDGDGDLDVLSASELDGKIAWYPGDGTGSFGAQQVIATVVGNPGSVKAADLDGDGDLDVLTAAKFGDAVTWYANDGSGYFGAASVITNSADDPHGIDVADLDSDGDIDVLVASREDDTVAWYRNDGTGSFGSQEVITATADGASVVAAADIDDDGDLDALIASAWDNTVAWHKNRLAPMPQILGVGCAGLDLSSSRMQLGAPWQLELNNIESGSPVGVFFVGTSVVQPPALVNSYCYVYVFNNLGFWVEPVIAGRSTHAIAIPNNASLLDVKLVVQGSAASTSSEAWNLGGGAVIALSNGLRSRVGI